MIRFITIRECSKLAQKKFKRFDHTEKWYVHKPESVQENKAHKIL